VAGAMASAWSASLNGGLGAEPPAWSRSRAPGGGSGRRSPPEAESFLVLERPTEWQNLSRYQFLAKCSTGTWYRFTPKILCLWFKLGVPSENE